MSVYARLEGSVEVKSLIRRYEPVDCAQAVKGEGLTVGKGVKSTHSDPGWLVLRVSGPRKQSFYLLWSPIPVFNADFSTRAGQHCLTWGGHSHICCSHDLDQALDPRY